MGFLQAMLVGVMLLHLVSANESNIRRGKTITSNTDLRKDSFQITNQLDKEEKIQLWRKLILADGCEYLSTEWSELPSVHNVSATLLGFTEALWSSGAPSDIELLGWSELSPVQQNAAGMFGYNEHSWNLGSAYDEYSWSELPQDIQSAALALGYNEEKWDYDLHVESEDKIWSELSLAEQQGAAVFGYDQESWDEVCRYSHMPSDQPSVMPSDQPSVMPSYVPTVV